MASFLDKQFLIPYRTATPHYRYLFLLSVVSTLVMCGAKISLRTSPTNIWIQVFYVCVMVFILGAMYYLPKKQGLSPKQIAPSDQVLQSYIIMMYVCLPSTVDIARSCYTLFYLGN